VVQTIARHRERTLSSSMRDLRRHAQALTGNCETGEKLVDLASTDLYVSDADLPFRLI